MIGYHEMRKLSPEKARELVRIVFEKNNHNISKTAKILGISRKPKSFPNKTPPNFEDLIVNEAKRTGFRYRRLKSFFERKYSLSFSENTIKAILRRNGISKEKRKRKKSGRHLYDYEALTPFRELQLDTKHIYDKTSLPPHVYEHMKKHNLPKYEWNIIMLPKSKIYCLFL